MNIVHSGKCLIIAQNLVKDKLVILILHAHCVFMMMTCLCDDVHIFILHETIKDNVVC